MQIAALHQKFTGKPQADVNSVI